MSTEPKKRRPAPDRATFFARYKWECILFVFTCLLYCASVFNNYNMDDELVTIQHRLTSKGISAIPEIFTSSYYEDASGYAYEYRPIVLATFAAEHSVAGDNPHVSHLVSLLLYALCISLLYLLLKALLPDYSRRLLFFIVLLFAAHPAHTEVVSSIKNRDEILALLFGLLALYASVRAVSGRLLWYAGVPMFALLALLSKKTAVPFVLIIPCALILCRPVRLRPVLNVALLLAVPFYWIMTDTVSHKVLMIVSLLSFIVLFFMLVHPAYFFERVARLRAYYKNEKAATVPFADQNDLKGFLGAAVRDLQVNFAWLPMGLMVLCLLLFFAGLYLGYLPAVATALALLTLGLWGNKTINWWASLGIYICVTISMILFSPGNSIYSNLLFISLAFQMLYSRGRLFIPALGLYAVLARYGSMASYLNLGVFMLVLYRWPRTRILSYVVFMLGIYDSVKLFMLNGIFSRASMYTTAYSVYMAVVFLLPLLLKRSDRQLRNAISAGVLLILMIYTWPGLQTNTARLMSMVSARTSGQDSGLYTTPAARQNRPLAYVENPVPADAPLTVKAGTSMEVLLHYLHKVVLPYPMAFYYGYRYIYPQRLTEPGPLLGVISYVLLCVGILLSLRRRRALALGLLIYLLSIVAVSDFFFPIPGMVAERYLLIPSLGWCLVLGTGLAYLLQRTLVSDSRALLLPAVRYTLLAILLLYSGITFARNLQWKDALTLMRHDISYVDRSAHAHDLLAIKLMKGSYEVSGAAQQDMQLEALGHFKQALAIYPGFYNAAYDLGRVYAALHMPDSSIAFFDRAMAIDSENTDPSLFIGEMRVEQGQYAAAIPALEYVVRHQPLNYAPYSLLSMAYFKTGRPEESIAVNQEAISRWPAGSDAYVNIARVYIAQSRMDSAIAYLSAAQRIAPGDQDISAMIRSVETSAKSK
ncbi:MAG: tetratricopeptide repeat protein [Bacteroidetes bacterium]|nr:tetratricopeptide repeat protein [Bacteroidota bacterium]